MNKICFLFLFSILTLCCVCWSANQPFNFFFFCRLFFSFLCMTSLLLFVWCCLESHLLYSHLLLLFIHCSAALWCLYYYFFLPQTSWSGLFFLLLLLNLVLVFPCFSIWLPLSFLHPSYSFSVCFILCLHLLLCSTCCVFEFVVRFFYLLYFTFCVGQ